MMLTAAIRRAACVRPHDTGIVDGEYRLSWREILSDVASMAGALRTAGLQPGGHVAVLAPNTPEHLELQLAVWWAGGVLVPLNTRLVFDELRFIVAHSEARVLVVDGTFAEMATRLQLAVPALERTLVMDAACHAEMTLHADVDDAGAPMEALAAIFYSGGTTGVPKGVELTHGNLAFAALNMQRDLRVDTDTVYLHAAPLFHVADFGIGLGVTLGAGAHSFLPQFTPDGFYDRLREDGVTHVQLVPTMLAMVLDAPRRDDQLLSQLRSVSYGAAPISQALLARALQAFPNARIQQFYGLTECAGACVMLPSNYHTRDGAHVGRLHAAGRATSGFELRVASPSGQPCSAGEIGEIQISGPAVMRGYWRDQVRTAEALVDGWLRSGDVGHLDEEGFVYVADRLKDMIISGGENIYCAEVESALSAHPAVLNCAVFGLPDGRWGERVHAAVVLKPGAEATASSLDVHCRKRIAGYKVPRSYQFRTAPLPLSGVGKVQKNRLRDEWIESQENT
jgi:long-chain acyl-CoA synthetase